MIWPWLYVQSEQWFCHYSLESKHLYSLCPEYHLNTEAVDTHFADDEWTWLIPTHCMLSLSRYLKKSSWAFPRVHAIPHSLPAPFLQKNTANTTLFKKKKRKFFLFYLLTNCAGLIAACWELSPPNQGLKPEPPALGAQVLTTGPLGSPNSTVLLYNNTWLNSWVKLSIQIL